MREGRISPTEELATLLSVEAHALGNAEVSLFGERACLTMPANVEQPRRDDKSAAALRAWVDRQKTGMPPCIASCKLLAVHTLRNDTLPWVHRKKRGGRRVWRHPRAPTPERGYLSKGKLSQVALLDAKVKLLRLGALDALQR